MVAIRVQGLEALFDRVVVAGATHQRRDIVVESLRPRDIPAILAVVEMAKRRIINHEPIRRLEKAVDLLLVLESALLPALCVYPNTPAMLKALDAYTGKLHGHAMAVGGQFKFEVWELCENLTDYSLCVEEEEEEEDQLKVRAGILIGEVTALLNDDLTISLNRW